MIQFLFSYGTLQHPKIQTELFGRILQGTKDVLKGYKLSTIEIKDKTFLSKGESRHQQTLIPSNEGNGIEGMILQLSEDELRLADSYEPNTYKRIKVMLQSGQEAWVYVAV